MIYLDNSATTKPDPSVVKSFQQVSATYIGNPSSIHHLGGQAEKLLMSARDQVADLLAVHADEIIFTSGGTEGNNLAIKGIAFEHQDRGKHIITSTIEHPSVYDTCQQLESLGFTITYLPVDKHGVISVADVEQAITDDTILITLMHVNNELGSIQPIEEVGLVAKKHPKIFFHVDDVQGVGKIPLTIAQSGIDCCTFSGHKIHGLKGTGVLYMNRRVTLSPLFHGGNQERGIRSGTENLAGAVSMARALRLIKEKETNKRHHLYELQAILRQGLEKIPHIVINSPSDGAAHIMNVSAPGFKPEVIIHKLSEHDIYISTKSACSSKQLDESRILTACGHDKHRANSALRISLSYDTTKEDIQMFLRALQQAIIQLKDVMG